MSYKLSIYHGEVVTSKTYMSKAQAITAYKKAYLEMHNVYNDGPDAVTMCKGSKGIWTPMDAVSISEAIMPHVFKDTTIFPKK